MAAVKKNTVRKTKTQAGRPRAVTVKSASTKPKKSTKGAAKRSDSQVSKKPHAESVSVSSVQSFPVLGVDGGIAGRMRIPEELFAAKVNLQALAQAVRVYRANQREGNAVVKTRGQVEGSTRKIFRQKGTGRARHGSIRAPIFVGGGVAFGPVKRNYSLRLSANIRSLALASALTKRRTEGCIQIVDGLNGLAPKTKNMVSALKALGRTTETTLLVTAKDEPVLVRISRNIPDVEVIEARNIHAYAVISHNKVIFTKESVSELTQTFVS